MKKITLYISLLLAVTRGSSYGQDNTGTGSCCVTALGRVDCVPDVGHDTCVAVGGSWTKGQSCHPNPCPTMICCYQGVCYRDVDLATCKRSGADNPWSLSNTCSFCTSTTNATMSTLKAEYSQESKAVQVTWNMEAGMDRQEFFIERSRNGQKFNDIGYMDKSSMVGSSFTFTDITPFTVGYYRLSFAKEGKLTYSQTITVVCLEEGKILLEPNPATSSLRVLLSNMQLYNTSISVTDLSGRVVLRRQLQGGQVDLDVSGLPPGFFIVRAQQNGKTYTEKLLKK